MTTRRITQPHSVKSSGTALGSRQVLAIVLSESQDRMGDSIIQSGIDHHNFIRGGGTVLWQHDYNYPVARTLRMNIVNGCLTSADAVSSGRHIGAIRRMLSTDPRGNCQCNKRRVQTDKMGISGQNRPGSGVLFSRVELIEFSYVSCPANPDALVIGKSYSGQREPTMRELGAQIGRILVAARLRAALSPRRTTYAERVAIARELRRGQ
jgi:hypothetical protein